VQELDGLKQDSGGDDSLGHRLGGTPRSTRITISTTNTAITTRINRVSVIGGL
jgi:hypothetical protein